MRSLANELIEALYPRSCPVCGLAASHDGFTCPAHALPDPLRGRRCRRCAQRIADWFPEPTTCAECRRRPPRFRTALCLGDYRSDAGLRGWVLALKHGGRRDLAPALGRLLAARLDSASKRANARRTWVCAVPLHPLRRLERGFDQAALLALGVAQALGRPSRAWLHRSRWTVPQGTPGAVSRRANVRGAFAVRARGRTALRGSHVILVDDVVTSGATVDACAGCLMAAGAAEVTVLALARAGPAVDGCESGLPS